MRKKTKEISNDIIAGKGFPDGNVKGEAIKARRLELDLGREGLFLRSQPRKIIIAEELLSIDGAGFAVAGFLMSKNSEQLLPKAVLLERHNVELLNGLVAAWSRDPNIVLPTYVWDVPPEISDKIQNGEILEITVEQGKATIRRITE